MTTETFSNLTNSSSMEKKHLTLLHLRLDVIKLVFGVSGQVLHKPNCIAIEEG